MRFVFFRLLREHTANEMIVKLADTANCFESLVSQGQRRCAYRHNSRIDK